MIVNMSSAAGLQHPLRARGLGGEHTRGEVLDPARNILEGRLEGFLRAQANRIRHRPVGAAKARQLLMGTVAHGHNKVAALHRLVQRARTTPFEIHAMTAGNLYGALGYPVRRVRSRRHRRNLAGLPPEGGGKLRPGTVPRADEQHAAGLMFDPWHQAIQRAGSEPDVAAPPVRFGAAADCQPGILECAQMVGQQVGRHPQLGLQLRRGEVPQGQQIHDAQPCGISKGRVPGDAHPESVSCLNFH